MTALAQDIVRDRDSLPELPPNLIRAQLQGTILYVGSAIMAVAGVARPVASGVAASTILGVNMVRRYTAPAGPNRLYTDDEPIVAARGLFAFAGLASDLPTDALINKAVPFADDNTVKATAASNDVTGILRFIKYGFYWVEVA